MKKGLLSLLIVAALSLAACQTDQWGNKQAAGTGLGALAGGLAGAQVGGGTGRLWATGAGVLIGAFMGNEIGASLDKADRMYMQDAQKSAMAAPVGETITWNNPESGHGGSYTPVRDGTSSTGRYCREYQQTVVINGQQQQAYGQACRQPDGSWELIKS